jgi:hypothetical protein
LHRRRGEDRLRRAVEEGEKSVAGRRHLAAAKAVDDGADTLVALAHVSGPRPIFALVR